MRAVRTAIEIRTYLRTVGVPGLVAAQRLKNSGATVELEVSRPECSHAFRLRVPSSDPETCEQIFIRRDYDFVTDIPPRTIVDAGANVGLASLLFANRFPEARILAIEPESDNYDLLRRNVAPYPNVTTVQAALWGNNERISLVDPGLGSWGFMTRDGPLTDHPTERVCHEVNGITVDWLMGEYGLDRIDVLKVDIEGAEKEVFSDTSAWIDRVDGIVAELHDRLKPGCSRSFYSGTVGFDEEWHQGENVFLSRDGRLRRP